MHEFHGPRRCCWHLVCFLVSPCSTTTLHGHGTYLHYGTYVLYNCRHMCQTCNGPVSVIGSGTDVCQIAIENVPSIMA
jgi:hypothetical protein